MDATPRLPRTPLRSRVPPVVGTVLAWGGAIAFPFVLYLTVLNGSNDGLFQLTTGVSARYLLLVLAMVLPIALLRRRPLTVLALMLLANVNVTMAINSSDRGYLTDVGYLQSLAIDLAVAFIATTRRRRVSAAAAVAALLVQIAAEFARPVSDDPVARTEVLILGMATAWMIGNSIRARREHAEALRVQAAAQAVTAERLRIARELHDMVAHSIGIIAIQAGVGSRVMDTQPAEARNALRAIEATSRDTLAGLRRVLGGLRQTQSRPGADPETLDPTPGLTDVDRLAATTAQAGVRVEVRWRGNRRPLPADIELSAFRIIQEAVTNVVRHAGTRECRVTVDYRDEELHIEITDDGQGCPVAGTGYGITGMRERVGLLHGEFSAGPRTEGGFRVTARLPVPDPVPAPVAAR